MAVVEGTEAKERQPSAWRAPRKQSAAQEERGHQRHRASSRPGRVCQNERATAASMESAIQHETADVVESTKGAETGVRHESCAKGRECETKLQNEVGTGDLENSNPARQGREAAKGTPQTSGSEGFKLAKAARGDEIQIAPRAASLERQRKRATISVESTMATE